MGILCLYRAQPFAEALALLAGQQGQFFLLMPGCMQLSFLGGNDTALPIWLESIWGGCGQTKAARIPA